MSQPMIVINDDFTVTAAPIANEDQARFYYFLQLAVEKAAKERTDWIESEGLINALQEQNGNKWWEGYIDMVIHGDDYGCHDRD